MIATTVILRVEILAYFRGFVWVCITHSLHGRTTIVTQSRRVTFLKSKHPTRDLGARFCSSVFDLQFSDGIVHSASNSANDIGTHSPYVGSAKSSSVITPSGNCPNRSADRSVSYFSLSPFGKIAIDRKTYPSSLISQHSCIVESSPTELFIERYLMCRILPRERDIGWSRTSMGRFSVLLPTLGF